MKNDLLLVFLVSRVSLGTRELEKQRDYPIMIKIPLLFVLFAILILTSQVYAKRVRVKGYYRKDGTYVQPHYRSAPDKNPYNNYGSSGKSGSYNSYFKSSKSSNNPYSSGFSNSFDSSLYQNKSNNRNYKNGGQLKWQNGYLKKNGSYSGGHFKTQPDQSKWNNRKNLYGW